MPVPYLNKWASYKIFIKMRNLIFILLFFFSSSYASEVDSLLFHLKNGDELQRMRAAERLGRLKEKTAVDVLINTLKDESDGVKKYACFALGEIGSPEAIKPLIALFSDPNKYVRGYAKTALLKIGEPASEPLARLLNNIDKNVRWKSAVVLGRMGDRRAVKPLMEALEYGGKEYRKEAALLLSQLKEKKAIRLLIRALGDDEKHVVKAARVGIIEWGKEDEEVVIQLITALKDEDMPRANICGALSAIGDSLAVEPIIDAAYSTDDTLRAAAALALGDFMSGEISQTVFGADGVEVEGEGMGVEGVEIENVPIQDERIPEVLLTLLGDERSIVRKYASEAVGKIKEGRAIPLLIELLDDKDISVRFSACASLAKIGKPSIDKLADALKNGSIQVRKYAAIALGKIGDEETISVLLNGIKDENWQVREAAVQALGQLRTEKALKGIISIFGDDDIRVRESASRAASQFGDAAIRRVKKMLVSKDEKVRATCIQTLGRVGDESSYPLIVKSLKDPALEVKKEAVTALGKFGQKAIEPLLRIFSDENDIVTRRAIINSLKRIQGSEKYILNALRSKDKKVKSASALVSGELRLKEAVPDLLHLLNDRNPSVKENATSALGKLRSFEAVEPIMKRIPKERNLEVKRELVYALGEIGDKKATPFLINLLKDTEMRSSVILALGELGDKSAIPYLFTLLNSRQGIHEIISSLTKLIDRPQDLETITEEDIKNFVGLLKSDDEFVRIKTKYLLSKVGKRATQPLLEVITYGKKREKILAITALGEIKDPESTPVLRKLLNSEDANIVRAAIIPLGKLCDEKSLGRMIELLKSEDFRTRYNAIYAIVRIGEPTSAIPLALLFDDPVYKVRKSAHAAIEELTGGQCRILGRFTPISNIDVIWFGVLAFVIAVPYANKWIPNFRNSLVKIGRRLVISDRVKWWIAFVLGIGAIGLYVYCQICNVGDPSGLGLTQMSFFQAIMVFTIKVFPFFIGGCLAAGFILRYFSFFQKNLPSSMLGSTSLGAVLPLCSCAVVPISRGMLSVNIPRRAVISFLMVTPVLNPFVIILSYGVIGLEFTLARIFSIFILAIASGILIEKLISEEEIDPDSGLCKLCSECAGASLTQSSSAFIAGWRMMGFLLRYMVIGIFLGAIVSIYLPPIVVVKYLSSNILGLLAAVTVGLPMYLCTGEEVLFLKPLMDMGLPLGHAIAFTLAANGICLSSIALLVGVIGKKTTILISAAFLVGPFILGYAINIFL